MKKYTSRATKWLIVVSLICGVVLLTGIILAFAGIGNIGLPIGLIMMGGLLGILFFSCFLAEKSRVLIISAGQIIFLEVQRETENRSFKKLLSKQVKSLLLKPTLSKAMD